MSKRTHLTAILIAAQAARLERWRRRGPLSACAAAAEAGAQRALLVALGSGLALPQQLIVGAAFLASIWIVASVGK